MERGIYVRRNDHGEWTVADTLLGYRVCAYHTRHRGGVHVHHGERVWPTTLATQEDAREVVHAYRHLHPTFDPAVFEEMVKAWRSRSRPS